MKIANFMFSESHDPALDHRMIQDSLAEARLCEELGFDAVFLPEHHFDGVCAFTDPLAFAMALATATKRIHIGFAVAQVSMHHPLRLAEQLSLLDNLTKGRVIVGFGRGSKFNRYEYDGYGISMEQSHEMMLEAEEIIAKAWSGAPFQHRGKFWTLDVRLGVRPRLYSAKPLIPLHAVGSPDSIKASALRCAPFLMAPFPAEAVRKSVALYREAAKEAGHSADDIAEALEKSWLWRHVHVASNDADARKEGLRAHNNIWDYRVSINPELQGDNVPKPPGYEEMLFMGSPSHVAERFREITDLGIGGALIRFRLGDMSSERAWESIRLFAEEVVPQIPGIHARRASVADASI